MTDRPDPIDVAFGEALRQKRLERGMTQDELGQQAGISYQQIQKYETASNRVSISRGMRLAQALNTTLAAMTRGIDVEPSA